MADLILAYDVGTTGVKAGLIDLQGKMLATKYYEYGTIHSGPGMVEQSVDEMWQAQKYVTKEIVNLAGIDGRDIASVAVSSQRATFAVLDENMQVIGGNFIGWQDHRGISQCETIKREIGEEEYYHIAGLSVNPVAAVSKILWVRENQPKVFDQAFLFASTQNVHLHQLGVEIPPCDLANAAYLGLMDVDKLEWSDELLEKLEIPKEKLPKLVPSGKQVGEVSNSAAAQTGLMSGTPIVSAGGDLQCAAVGMGVTIPGYVSVGIGTGGGVLICLEKSLRHPERSMNCQPHAVEGYWEMEGIALASGGAYKWLRDTLGEYEQEIANTQRLDPYTILNERAAEAPVGSKGLLTIPSIMGAGSPNWNPNVPGFLLNLHNAVGKPEVIRSMLEGICLEIRWIIDETRKLGTNIEEVRIWGGAAKSTLWNQIASDVYGVPAARAEVNDAGLAGAAVLAAVGVGIFDDAIEGSKSMVRIVERYEPNPDNTDTYDELFELYKDIYKTFDSNDIYTKLKELREKLN